MLIAVMKIHHIFHSLAPVKLTVEKNTSENYFTGSNVQHDDVCAD